MSTAHTQQAQLFTNSNFDNTNNNKTGAPKVTGKNLPDPTNQIMDIFDLWLSGVNERLNAAMNYQFSEKPDPAVYYISTVSSSLNNFI